MLVAANGAGVKAGRAATARAMAVVTSQVLTRCVYTDGHFFRLFSTNNHKGPPSRRSCQLPVPPHYIYRQTKRATTGSLGGRVLRHISTVLQVRGSDAWPCLHAIFPHTDPCGAGLWDRSR